ERGLSVEPGGQPSPPGARRSSPVPTAATPPELNAETLLRVQPPVKPGRLRSSCARARKLVDAPTLTTAGSPAGLPTVPNGPPSPLAATTVIPAATAAWLANEIGSVCRSGIG